MIDVHCHILPGIDYDGPSHLDDVLEMGRIAAADGIRQALATVHIKDGIDHAPSFLREQVQLLNKAFEDNGIALTVLPGAEVNSLVDPAKYRQYTLNGTDYLLLEFPHSYLPQNAAELVFDAAIKGLRPIIAHPERNGSIMRKPELALELVKAGALLQVTADSILGDFGPEARECSLFLLDRGVVHTLATDAHSPTWRRPLLSRGLKIASRVLGKEQARRLVADNPAAIISGRPLYE